MIDRRRRAPLSPSAPRRVKDHCALPPPHHLPSPAPHTINTPATPLRTPLRWSIATKLFLAIAGVIATFTGVLLLGAWRTQQLHDQFATLHQHIVPLSILLSDAQNDLRSLDMITTERDQALLRRALRSPAASAQLPYTIGSKLGRAVQQTRSWKNQPLPEPYQRRMGELHARLLPIHEESIALISDVEQLAIAEEPRQAEQREQTRDAIRDLDINLARLRSDLRLTTDLAMVRAAEDERANIVTLGLGSAIALVIALALLIAALITVRPLRLLTEGARRVARGDYQPIPHARSGLLGEDEIAQLTHEFNGMSRSLAMRDETVQQQHEALLRSERLATIGRMTSHITHELRNPLSSIGLNAEMVLDELSQLDALPEDLRADLIAQLETISAEVERLRDITEEYLGYARLPAPRLTREDLRELIDGLIDFHQLEWAQREVHIIWEPGDATADALIDPQQLRQALLNLLRNAVEASPPQGTITLLLDRAAPPHAEGAWHRIRVIDQGEGIAADAQAHIFEPFFTTKHSGTGLGLAITQQIIEEHGGQLRLLDSAPGHTTLAIYIPTDEETPT
jgi:two-component system, NtrC family, sensor kinase